MELQYNQEIEVTKQKFDQLFPMFNEILAHRTENGKYYIKLMVPAYKKEVNNILKLQA